MRCGTWVSADLKTFPSTPNSATLPNGSVNRHNTGRHAPNIIMNDKLRTIALVFIIFAAATTFSAKDKLSEDPVQNDKITLTSVKQELPPAETGPTIFPLIGENNLAS